MIFCAGEGRTDTKRNDHSRSLDSPESEPEPLAAPLPVGRTLSVTKRKGPPGSESDEGAPVLEAPKKGVLTMAASMKFLPFSRYPSKSWKDIFSLLAVHEPFPLELSPSAKEKGIDTCVPGLPETVPC